MKKVTMEEMDNGFLLVFESDKTDPPVRRYVFNNIRKAANEIAFFFTGGPVRLDVKRRTDVAV